VQSLKCAVALITSAGTAPPSNDIIVRLGVFAHASVRYRKEKGHQTSGGLICHPLVPATANACVPICTPAGGGVIACACCCRTIVCTPMYAPIDASNAHRCQWTAKSGVRSIN